MGNPSLRLSEVLKENQKCSNMVTSILDGFENASLYFAIFLQTVYSIEKFLTGFNVQPRIGMDQSLI